jgi:hypothetical protein
MKTIKLFAVALFILMAAGAQAQTQTVTIDGDHGKLHAVIHKPELKDGERCPMVLLCHGYMGNKEGAWEKQIAALLQAKGIIHYPEAIKWANDEKIRQTNYLKMMDAKHMLPFLWRSLQMGCWRGYILSIMHGGWSQEIEDFCSWSVSYDMWCKSYYFGQLIEKDFNVIEQGGHRPTMLLPMLQNTFTYNDAVSIRRIMNKPTTSRAVRNMLNQWIHRKLVTYDKDTKKYHKTNTNH